MTKTRTGFGVPGFSPNTDRTIVQRVIANQALSERTPQQLIPLMLQSTRGPGWGELFGKDSRYRQTLLLSFARVQSRILVMEGGKEREKVLIFISSFTTHCKKACRTLSHKFLVQRCKPQTPLVLRMGLPARHCRHRYASSNGQLATNWGSLPFSWLDLLRHCSSCT